MRQLSRFRIHKQVAASASVEVNEKNGVRYLHLGSETIQSAMRRSRPNELELSYTRCMMAFLLFVPTPTRVVMIGLGGGSLARFVYHNLPETRITAVEISPQVVSAARQFFELPDDPGGLP
jgi:spermidine synthase